MINSDILDDVAAPQAATRQAGGYTTRQAGGYTTR
ncbi:hypothetical protein SAMN04515692_11225 [Leifsonia sp. CL147]|nr:hypothetical protein SAMN04515694_11225 [Leifsonia sp. CL154]SFL76971.1 hypothetical protein SAMN04515692_11225 [Leifsonia sp. CL147]